MTAPGRIYTIVYRHAQANAWLLFGLCSNLITHSVLELLSANTCHLYGAGFDLSSIAGLKEVSAEIESTNTWDKVKLIRLNDSKAPLGRNKDMHEHIGQGFVRIESFRNIVNHPEIEKNPVYLKPQKIRVDPKWKILKFCESLSFNEPGAVKNYLIGML